MVLGEDGCDRVVGGARGGVIVPRVRPQEPRPPVTVAIAATTRRTRIPMSWPTAPSVIAPRAVQPPVTTTKVSFLRLCRLSGETIWRCAQRESTEINHDTDKIIWAG